MWIKYHSYLWQIVFSREFGRMEPFISCCSVMWCLFHRMKMEITYINSLILKLNVEWWSIKFYVIYHRILSNVVQYFKTWSYIFLMQFSIKHITKTSMHNDSNMSLLKFAMFIFSFYTISAIKTFKVSILREIAGRKSLTI